MFLKIIKNSSLILCLGCLLCACDPRKISIMGPFVKIKGSFNMVKDTFNIGETLVLKVEIPNPVTDSDGRTEEIKKFESAFFQLGIVKIDTLNKVMVKILNGDKPEMTVIRSNLPSTGNQEGTSFCYFPTTPPYQYTISMTFKMKGLYYVAVNNWPGEIRLNKSFGAKLRVDFDTPDANIKFLEPYLGWEQADGMRNSKKQGFGVYAFWVK
jgi:hypothetical protein